MTEEPNERDGSFQMSVNGEDVQSDGQKMAEEEVKDLLESVNQGVNSMMNEITEKMKAVFDNINVEKANNLSNLSPSNWLHHLSGNVSKLNKINLLRNLPVLETSEENGKFQVLLNKEKLIEVDLTKFKKEE